MSPTLPIYADHARPLLVRDAEGRERPIETADDWRVRRDHILGALQAVMGPLPGAERRVPLDLRRGGSARVGRCTRTAISYASEPGDRVTAWLFEPAEMNAGPFPAVVALHQTTAIGKDEPAGVGGLANLHYGAELAERGYVVLCPDYPNFGGRKLDVYERGYLSASMKGVWDHMRGVDLLQALPFVDPSRIGAIGHSLGGHNAIFLGVFDERVRAIVSSCGFNAFPHYYGGNIAGWSHGGYMPRLASVYGLDLKRVPFDFPELIAALAPRGFFTNSPTRDENFALEGVRTSVEAARGVYRLLRADERLRAEHPDCGHDFPEAQRRSAYAFLDAVLTAR